MLLVAHHTSPWDIEWRIQTVSTPLWAFAVRANYRGCFDDRCHHRWDTIYAEFFDDADHGDPRPASQNPAGTNPRPLPRFHDFKLLPCQERNEPHRPWKPPSDESKSVICGVYANVSLAAAPSIDDPLRPLLVLSPFRPWIDPTDLLPINPPIGKHSITCFEPSCGANPPPQRPLDSISSGFEHSALR